MIHFDNPDEFVGYENHDQYDNVLPGKPEKAGKPAKQAKNGKDQSSKDKKPVVPIIPHYEGWIITVLDALRTGETSSWVKTHKDVIPLSSSKLRDQAVAHEKQYGNVSYQFQKLGVNQRRVVNRMILEKNSEEQQPNAEWILFGVKKLYTEEKGTFRSNKINNSMRVTLLRQEKVKDVAELGTSDRRGVMDDDDDVIDLTKPLKSTKNEASPKASKDGDKKGKGDKKKANKKGKDEPLEWNTQNQQQAQDNFSQWPAEEPWPEAPYQEREQQPQRQPQQQQQQQYQQQQYQQQQQPQYGDPFGMHGMSGTLPNDGRPIPVPTHERRPEAPMPPQHPHQNPFQAYPGVFPQPDSMNDPRQHEHPDFGQQYSARRRSHSRPREGPERDNRRESPDSDKTRRKELRKLKTELLDEVRGEVRGALREAAAEDKVHRWPAGSFPPTTSSGPSTGQDDMWSPAASSDGRRYSHGSPDTSPDRSDRFYQQQRPSGSLHRRDSAGYESYRPDGRRYYRDGEHVYKPHDSQRERRREIERGRTPPYAREQRQLVDDYPDMQHQQHQRRRHEPRVYVERPPVQRRVTDYPETLPHADFGRRRRNDVDYTDPFVYADNRERRSGRERQQQYYRG